ncbi:RNA-binding protein 34 isoform X1 [Cyprinodon tularosa]|uniref:RNA-binding protein 34 isoform X1 n=1 Tax=Cyprinodon tularosa TaxID=77115 RepID=UPI0018E202C4|nr:RNA-binding protein 34 isoform X1 [Cyprinodon tularosa]
MKKKANKRDRKLQAEQPSDYAVGQVSGSLSQEGSTAWEPLAELFRPAFPASSQLFLPPPRVIGSSAGRAEQSKDSIEVEVKAKKKRKRSVAEQELLNRESCIFKADRDEHGPASSAKRKKRDSETDGQIPAEHWALRRQRLKANKQGELLKMKRTVFVGNLPISCTAKTLRGLFRDKGPIESVRFRSVVREDPSMSQKEAFIKRKVHPKKQSLNAYVVFKDEEAVCRALERNGVEIEEGFHIRVDRVTQRSSHDHKRSIFVGNLAFDLKELALRQHFEPCGTVEAVRLVRDAKSGLGKGFGYVLFESADSVQLALSLDGSQLESRSIRVKRSVKKEEQKKTKDGGMLWSSSQKASGRPQEHGKGNFKSKPNNCSSFKGEVADPRKKTKKALKGKKKKKKRHLVSKK